MAASEEGQAGAQSEPAITSPAACAPDLAAPELAAPELAAPELAGEEGRPRAAGKSVTAFRTISEVSTDLEVPQHVLRFWESKFTQLRPLKRGGGRRYYRPEDIALLRVIHGLLYGEGYTIKGVQQKLRNSRRPGPANTDQAKASEAAPLVAEPTIPGLPKPAPKISNMFLSDLLAELKELRGLLD